MKCFLSHSSKDKQSYVGLVAERLLPNISYDEITFEEGMGNLEEILRGIKESDLFVLFISENSLNSAWVRREITEAQGGLANGTLKRFFPIVIDSAIHHSDKRIPDWIRENYNLRPITRPTIAARRLKQRMIELSWTQHPLIKKRQEIFIGRNNILSDCEQRFDDFNKGMPLAFFASGLRSIGRKTTMLRALNKSNIVRPSYDPIRISLNGDDGLDEFILRLSDAGISTVSADINFLETSVEDKVALAAEILRDFQKSNEIVLIEDGKCIVRFEGIIADWFLQMIERLDSRGILLCVAPYFRPQTHQHVRNNKLFFINVPELDHGDRVGLFLRYCRLYDLDLEKPDVDNFSSLLTGYPEQVAYAVDMIATAGIDKAWRESKEIVAFSNFRASKYIERYALDQDKLDFLRFIASFDFVSLIFISEIGELVEKSTATFVDEFISDAICERIGVAGEYVRLNDVVRDYVNRSEFSMQKDYAEALKTFTERFLGTYADDGYDMSEYYIAIKEALGKGLDVPERMLTPSHFISSMKDLYNRGSAQSYQQIVRLARRVLQKSNSYDAATEQNIRYYLCQSLARLRDKDFLTEVQGIKGPEHTFLLGFYYRLQERYDEAIAKFLISMKDKRTDQRSRRELVLAYVALEKYDDALQIAMENYQKYPSNPLLLQAYFECLLNQKSDQLDSKTMMALLDDLITIGSDKSQSIHAALKSRYALIVEGDAQRAVDLANDAIASHPDDIYMVVSKIEIGIRMLNESVLREALNEHSRRKTGQFAARGIVAKGRALLAGMQGRKSEAYAIIERDLKWMPKNSITEIKKIVADFS